ncbi:hypothetical protein GZH47_31765 (plasmid) [Paenibacillus rhizovicinus]|uniref:Uncharacterized protein n=1 Tax=Paenibacillus rhizovicinus TaxID=2704463 RepID=A0A6C0PAS5_9BACL|nr:hypothetical protein [Paenibacillus rhizovicinus]QHW35475.1 hypothetical protein GZH47_31765 [Paenibacillus rhizovicinus]
MSKKEILTTQDILAIVSSFRDRRYPDKSIEEVLAIANCNAAFSIEDAIEATCSQAEIESHLHSVYLCDTLDSPDNEDDGYTDPKEDVGFWRTGIRIFLLSMEGYDMTGHYQAKASEKERTFLRKFGKEGYVFFTVKGHRPNTIQKVTKDYIYVTTEKSEKPNRIPRASLRRALSVLFYRRVTTLKALIRINSFSSAIAGLIKTIMSDICKVTETKSRAVRLTLRGLRYIFSGVSKGMDDARIVRENGGRFLLLSYYYLRSDPSYSWKQRLRELGYEGRCVILDPGGKSYYEAVQKGKNPNVIFHHWL